MSTLNRMPILTSLLEKNCCEKHYVISAFSRESVVAITTYNRRGRGDAGMRIFVTRELVIALGRRTVTQGVLALPVCVGWFGEGDDGIIVYDSVRPMAVSPATAAW